MCSGSADEPGDRICQASRQNPTAEDIQFGAHCHGQKQYWDPPLSPGCTPVSIAVSPTPKGPNEPWAARATPSPSLKP